MDRHQHSDQRARASADVRRSEGARRPAWQKPTVVEAACGLEINCYATGDGA